MNIKVALFVLFSCIFVVNISHALCPSELPAAIDNILAQSSLQRARWGIRIISNTSTVLYDLNSNHLFVPASNTKLLSTSTAFLKYTPVTATYFRTKILLRTDGSTNTLCLIGGADPLAVFFSKLAASMNSVAATTKTVNTMYVDSTAVPTRQPGNAWSGMDDVSFGYSQPYGAFILGNDGVSSNYNNLATITVRPGATVGSPAVISFPSSFGNTIEYTNEAVTTSAGTNLEVGVRPGVAGIFIGGTIAIGGSYSTQVAIFPPEKYFGNVAQYMFQKAGGSITETKYEACPFSSTDSGVTEILNQITQMSSVLQPLLINSDNLYAEAVLQKIGSDAVYKTGDLYVDGMQEVVRVLTSKLGIDPESLYQADASGMSYRNQIAPATLVRILQGLQADPNGKNMRLYLAVAGQSGTLIDRLTTYAGKVQAKTGTLSGIGALSGYAQPANYNDIIFSIIVNNSEQDGTTLKNAIDNIVSQFMQLDRSCA